MSGRMLLALCCLLATLMLVAGCDKKGVAKVPDSKPKIIEPAMIISRADARALTGIDFDECKVKEQPAVGLKMCVYENDKGFLQVGITQTAFYKKGTNSSNTPKATFQSLKDTFRGAEQIDEVGDDNFIAPPGLHILMGGYYLTVSYGLNGNNKIKLKAAGLKAVENLNKYSR